MKRVITLPAGLEKNPLFWNSVLMAGSILVLIPLALTDGRLVSGMPVWIKPIKFSSSLALYSATLLWILQFLNISKPTLNKISWVITITSVIEIVCIFLQAGRGIPSHFNITNPINSFIFSLMGISIFIFWIAHLMIAIHIVKQVEIDPFLKECLVWGLGIAAYGMILGFFMTAPRPEQIEGMKQGIINMNGGHTFGGADDGPGLSILGWSTVAGDMRVPHFFGMHAMQFFSIIAYFFIGPKIKPARYEISKYPIRIIGISYLAIVFTMNVQVLQKESIFQSSMLFFSIFSVACLTLLLGIFFLIRLKNQNLKNRIQT